MLLLALLRKDLLPQQIHSQMCRKSHAALKKQGVIIQCEASAAAGSQTPQHCCLELFSPSFLLHSVALTVHFSWARFTGSDAR